MSFFSSALNPLLRFFLISPADGVYHGFLIVYLVCQSLCLLCFYGCLLAVGVGATLAICSMLVLFSLFFAFLIISRICQLIGRLMQMFAPQHEIPVVASSGWSVLFNCLVNLTSYIISPFACLVPVLVGSVKIEDGYCYLHLFPGFLRIVIGLALGRMPLSSDVAFLASYLPGSGVALEITAVNGVFHARPKAAPGAVAARMRFGSATAQRFGELLDGFRTLNPIGGNAASFLPGPSKRKQKRIGGLISKKKEEVMKPASTLAAGEVLLGPKIMNGTNAENLAIAKPSLDGTAVRTHIPISNRKYKDLTNLLGVPLDYVPGTSAHEEAATCRRAWLKKMSELTEFAVVLMISPSLNEWHKNPNGLAYYPPLVDSLDFARIAKPCPTCRAGRCAIVQQAVNDERILHGSLGQVAAQAKFYRVDVLWMLNIEPNIPTQDILTLMRLGAISTAYSASHADWRCIGLGRSYCSLTTMETTEISGTVYAAFQGSGEYAVSSEQFRQMFRPTVSQGFGLRRTIIGRAHSSMLMEIQVTSTGSIRPMIPDRYCYYIIPVPHPRSGLLYLRVEKAGFDRTLQLYRTTPEPSVAGARIALRQANVTYSISGTSLTARIDVSASDSEFLALWMYSYSKTMQEYEKAVVSTKVEKAGLFASLSTSLVNGCQDAGIFTNEVNAMRWLSIALTDDRVNSLDEISDHAYAKLFGSEVGVTDGMNFVLEKWREYLDAHPLVNAAVEVFRTSFQGVFSEIFGMGFTISKLAINLGMSVCDNLAFLCDVAASVAGGLGYTEVAARLRSWSSRFLDSDVFVRLSQALKVAVDACSLSLPEAAASVVKAVREHYGYRSLTELERDAVDREMATRWPGDDGSMARERINEILSSEEGIVVARLEKDLVDVLCAIPGRAERRELVRQIVLQSDEDVGRCSLEQRTALTRLVETMPVIIESAEKKSASIAAPVPQSSKFALTGNDVVSKPVPIEVLYTTEGKTISVEAAFESGEDINIDHGVMVNQPRTLRRLEVVEGKASFAPIHESMVATLPSYQSGVIEPRDVARAEIITVSSDEEGAKMVKALLDMAKKEGEVVPVVDNPTMIKWAAGQVKGSKPQLTEDWDHVRIAAEEVTDMDMSKFLNKIPALAESEGRIHACHIEGVAMAGKSAGIRPLLTKDDLIVVPSRWLAKDWEKEIKKLPVESRPTVLTQHKAIGVKVKGNVYLDEVYQLDPPHIEALRRCPGEGLFITIGDCGQISNVLSETIPAFDPTISARSIAIFPTSFCPYDIFVEYLRRTHHKIRAPVYYSGTTVGRGLRYVVSNDVVVPSHEDLAINALQKSKATMKNRGVKERRVTAHESQGMRSEHTYVHAMLSSGACPDLAFLSDPVRGPWYVVVITRARQSTTFIVPDRESALKLPYADVTAINGKYSTSLLYSGTHFDLYDPVTLTDITYSRSSNPVTQYAVNEQPGLDLRPTLGAMIDPATNEAIAKEEFTSDIDVGFATKATLSTPLPRPFVGKETYNYNPSHVIGATEVEIASERSSKPEGEITSRDYAKADKIVKELFDKILEPEMFFKLADYDHSAINRHDRDKFMDRLTCDYDAKSSAMSYAFGKNESSKRQVVANEGAKLKLLAVLGMPPAQLLIFDEVVEALSSAFCMSLRPGIVSPYRRTKMDINDVLGAFEGAFELDLERQDQSHDRLHVAVFLRLVEIVAKRRGMVELVGAIRVARRVRSLSGIVIFLQGCGLGSGDSWTLISNMIMAFSTLLARFEVKRGSVMLQIGDDITCKERLKSRDVHLVKFHKAKFKVDDHMHTSRPSFTSRTAITETTAIPVRIRGIVSAGFKPRSRAMHEGYKTSVADFFREVAEVGISQYCEYHSAIWHGDKYESEAGALENIIHEAKRIVDTPFDELPEHLRLMEADVQVLSSNQHCFANALARCVENNVAAANVYADRFRYDNVALSVCVKACEDNNVPFTVIPRTYPFANPSRAKSIIVANASRPQILLFKDHAILVRPVKKLDYSIMKWQHVNVLLHDTDDSETSWM